jgi:GT2 family glycosyltransferase
MRSSPVAVIIPTYNRGTMVLDTIRRAYSCTPRPAEVWIHIDAADGTLEDKIVSEFPEVSVLTSKVRLGPGGGRHRCLLNCASPYAVSFDDDSYPVDEDFFGVVTSLFENHPMSAIFVAQVWQRNEPALARTQRLDRSIEFIGCGYAIRVSVYRTLPGYLPSPVPYGMEETDLALQLFSSGWEIKKSGELRVFHNTDLSHHASKENVAGLISNIALFSFINYPVALWLVGALQVAKVILFCIRIGRSNGVLRGLAEIPGRCHRHRKDRRPLSVMTVLRFLSARRHESSKIIDRIC